MGAAVEHPRVPGGRSALLAAVPLAVPMGIPVSPAVQCAELGGGSTCGDLAVPVPSLPGGARGSRTLCPTGAARDGLCALQREGGWQRARRGRGGLPPAPRVPVRPRPHAARGRLHPHPRLQQLPGPGGAFGPGLGGAGRIRLQRAANAERGNRRSARRLKDGTGCPLHPWGHRCPLRVPQAAG